MTTDTATVKTGTWITSTTNDRLSVEVIAAPQYLRPAPGMFVCRFDYTGLMFFARFTGRTTVRHGHTVATVERVAIDTVSDGEGVLWGVPGDKVTGTWYVYDHQVTAA